VAFLLYNNDIDKGGSIMRIMIIGAGSLGLLFASKLAACCTQLTVVTRTQEQAEELKVKGIELVGMDLPMTTTKNDIDISSYLYETSDPHDSCNREVDYIFLMVKQTAITEEFIHFIRKQMTSDTYVISFQNGIGHEHKLSQASGEGRLLLAVTTEGAKRNSWSRVSHTGHGVTYIGRPKSGELEIGTDSHILLIELLERAGFQTVLSKNMEVRVWQKLAVNAVINPLTAILRVSNGELLQSEWTRSLMLELYQEFILLAALRGISLPEELWATILHVCQATSSNHSSMLQDVEAGRPTEIDYMNGRLVQMANDVGIELPANNMVYKLIKAIEK
jgi:2-dehydropantoate 2-reductase